MLCQFTFKNFRSYKEETVLDFRATAIPEFKESLINDTDGTSLLPVEVVYGPNGGGKSNLLMALSCLISTVSRPIYDIGKAREQSVIQEKVDCFPYMLDQESRKQPSEFEVFFRRDYYNKFDYSQFLYFEQ